MTDTPALTAEDRAREIVGALALALADADGTYFLGSSLQVQKAYIARAALAESRIASAIMEAEWAAYERVAVLLDTAAEATGHDDDGRNHEANLLSLAETTRALKSQKETP